MEVCAVERVAGSREACLGLACGQVKHAHAPILATCTASVRQDISGARWCQGMRQPSCMLKSGQHRPAGQTQ